MYSLQSIRLSVTLLCLGFFSAAAISEPQWSNDPFTRQLQQQIFNNMFSSNVALKKDTCGIQIEFEHKWKNLTDIQKNIFETAIKPVITKAVNGGNPHNVCVDLLSQKELNEIAALVPGATPYTVGHRFQSSEESNVEEYVEPKYRFDSKNWTKNERLDLNMLVKWLDDADLTSQQKKILGKEVIDITYNYEGEVSDVRSEKEVVVMLDTGNYLNLFVPHDPTMKSYVDTASLNKGEKISGWGELTFLGTGIALHHSMTTYKVFVEN